jgi:hypothetical protein
MADHLTVQYDASARFLRSKKCPARKEAQRIKELRARTRSIIQEYKKMQYRFDFLLQLFPDLELYVDSFELIAALGSLDDLSELEDTVDRTRYYLSQEEYNKLAVVERNQLALDRYIQSEKTKWEIGRDYELSVGYEYEQEGWEVEYFGVDKGLNDMGRDLIAKRGNVIHIVQCKYWAQRKMIHEKHIAQLYGTTFQFKLQHPTVNQVVPVFVTNIRLSETAKLFAEHLGVQVHENKEMTKFPRVKCKVNRGQAGPETRIYHLPMDQQYNKTRISHKGDFWVHTVQEAVDAGFRRAKRWIGDAGSS